MVASQFNNRLGFINPGLTLRVKGEFFELFQDLGILSRPEKSLEWLIDGPLAAHPSTMQEARGNGLYTRHVYSILNLLDEELDAGGRVKQLGDTRDSGTLWHCGRMMGLKRICHQLCCSHFFVCDDRFVLP